MTNLLPITATRQASARLTDNEFALWRELIRSRCGTDFTEARRHRLETIIRERCTRSGAGSFTEYFNHIVYRDTSGSEWLNLLDRLLNHESSFFRHAPSFDGLWSVVLPEIADRKRESGHLQLNVWSAGCAGGQEATSLGILLAECGFIPARGSRLVVVATQSEHWQVEILATDLGRRVIERVSAGRLQSHETRGLEARFRQRYFSEEQGGVLTVCDEIRSRVQARVLDLVADKFDAVGMQDVIFCQNVLIYFQQAVRVSVVNKLCDRLKPGGVLFPGPGELIGYRPPGTQVLNLPDCLAIQRL